MKERPKIIQGGMGAGVSNWQLARAVSKNDLCLGVVSGTALDVILARRLQDGDLEGNVRYALGHFPFQEMAKRISEAYFLPEGRKGKPYKRVPMHTLEGNRESQELCIAGNFVEVFLAREGHSNPVGINYLEKIQLPHLPSIYGAMLANVDTIIMGAGIPIEIPGVLDALAKNQPTSYPIHVSEAQPGKTYRISFDPSSFQENGTIATLQRPDFLPIIASDALGSVLIKRSNGKISGFIVEGPRAGGHNAPPRGKLELTGDGQPIYGPRDVVDMKEMQKMGLPFWLAGSYGSAERFQEATSQDQGASGIQVGTAFALCRESALSPEIKQRLIQRALNNEAVVFTDPTASPTGYPFKVARLEGTLSEPEVYAERQRVCDLGFLRELYQGADCVGYRCPAEPTQSFIAKGGKLENTVGRKCVCNGLIANIGIPQVLRDGTCEKALVTLGDDFAGIGRFCTRENPDYTAEHVIKVILNS
jgi:nitronate monooxygenase